MASDERRTVMRTTSATGALAAPRRTTSQRQRQLGYADVYDSYMAAGWTPLPLPRKEKKHPPGGYTGRRRGHPSYQKYIEWAHDFPLGNVALALPDGVVGIDIDIHDDKHGGETFHKLSMKLGPVPGTWYSTSRQVSEHGIPAGIHMYRVPSGVEFKGSLPGAVDLIQHVYRYAVVYPSIHPEGRMYRWYGPDGKPSGIPRVAELPKLPEKWVETLKRADRECTGKGFDGTIDEWFDGFPDNKLAWYVAADYKRAVERLRTCPDGSRHDAMGKTVDWLVKSAVEHRFNPADVLWYLRMEFIRVMNGERDAEYEFDSRLEWAITNFGAR